VRGRGEKKNTSHYYKEGRERGEGSISSIVALRTWLERKEKKGKDSPRPT